MKYYKQTFTFIVGALAAKIDSLVAKQLQRLGQLR